MKRIIVIGLMALALMGCGNEDTNKVEPPAPIQQGNVQQPPVEEVKEEVVLIGSTKEQIIEEFKDWEKDTDYETKVDPDALKFTKDEVMAVVDFDKKSIAEGVSFLSNNFDETNQDTGQGAYTDTHYNELVKWTTGGKQIKIEKNKSTKYPVEIYIGNIHQ